VLRNIDDLIVAGVERIARETLDIELLAFDS
jgi:hypothetical protein